MFNEVCGLGVDIGQNGDPAGWSVFVANLSIGGEMIVAPEPQFLWELLTEIAQIVLNDPTGDGVPDITEGDVRPIYALREVELGLTGDQVIANLRTTLQRQAKVIADIIMGDYWVESDALDFYLSRGAPGRDLYLFFVAEDDLRPDAQGSDKPRSYTYTKPGFFSSPDLSEQSRGSAKHIDGVADTIHEKYRLLPGTTTRYVQDDEDATYEIRLYVPEGEDPVEINGELRKL